jgi:hypothetical protein
MNRQSPGSKASANNRYWQGIFTGMFLGGFFIVAMILIFIRMQGFKVAINPAEVASLVRTKVQLETKQDIPEILEGLKLDLPGRIAGNLNGLADLRISFGESEVQLPPEILAAIKTEFDRIIEEAVLNTINDFNTTGYQERLGKNVYETVLRLLNQEIIGKTYLVKSSRWLTIPVKIVGSARENLRIGI